MTGILRLLSFRGLTVRPSHGAALLLIAHLVSAASATFAADATSFGQPRLTTVYRQQLAEAAHAPTLPPWQRELMTAMMRDGRTGAAGEERAQPSRATPPERTTSADGTWIREPLQDSRVEHTAIYDPVRDRMVVFGGAAGEDQDVWALSLSGSPQWTRLTPGGTPPSARIGHTAIYDPLRDRMVVFGGAPKFSSIADLLNDVWSLSLAGSPEWTQLTPSGTPPSPRSGHTAIYDPVRDRMVVYGGGYYPGDVWSLSLAGSPAWTQLSPAGTPPGGRWEHTAIYDPVRDRMVVFGGATGSQPYDYHNDVWALSLAGTPAWTQLTPAGTPPVPRYGHSAIYDPVRDGMVVFGGHGGGYVADTWFLALGSPTWTQLTPTGTPPAATLDHTAIYDPVRDRMVVYGGLVYDGASTDVWVLSPPAGSPAWTRLTAAPPAPPAQVGPPAYDSVHHRMVVLNYGFSQAWALSLESSPVWAPITLTGTPPVRRLGYSSIYDPVRDRVVIFGGRDVNGFKDFNDVWALSLAGTPTWTRLTPSGTPPRGRESHTAIYDPVRDGMVVFGGSGGFNPDNALNDTWTLSLSGSPAWVQIGPRAGLDNPDGRNSHSAIYDPVRDCMTIFGGRAANSEFFAEVWTLSLADRIWTQLTPSGTAPTGRDRHTAIYDSVRDRMVVFGGFGGNPTSWRLDVWSLSLGVSPTWGQLNPVGAPSTVGGTGIYDPVGDRMVLFGIGGSVAAWDLWWGPPVTVATLLAQFDATRTEHGIELRWRFNEAQRVENVDLERSMQIAGPWSAVAAEIHDDSGVTVVLDPEVDAHREYFYRLVARLADGSQTVFGPVSALGREISSASEITLVSPNPSTGRAQVQYLVARAGRVRLEVVDVSGRVVATLADGVQTAGRHVASWDGMGTRAQLHPGLYFVRLTAPDRTAVRSFAVIR